MQRAVSSLAVRFTPEVKKQKERAYERFIRVQREPAAKPDRRGDLLQTSGREGKERRAGSAGRHPGIAGTDRVGARRAGHGADPQARDRKRLRRSARQHAHHQPRHPRSLRVHGPGTGGFIETQGPRTRIAVRKPTLNQSDRRLPPLAVGTVSISKNPTAKNATMMLMPQR